MSFSRFKATWANIHLPPVDQGNASDEDPEGETGNGDDTSAEEVLPLEARWYAKAALLIDNVKKVSQHLFIWSGFSVSIDETTKKFKGRSKQTFRMKNKPVKEGYKFWEVWCAATGFCYKVIPAARVGNKNE